MEEIRPFEFRRHVRILREMGDKAKGMRELSDLSTAAL